MERYDDEINEWRAMGKYFYFHRKHTFWMTQASLYVITLFVRLTNYNLINNLLQRLKQLNNQSSAKTKTT